MAAGGVSRPARTVYGRVTMATSAHRLVVTPAESSAWVASSHDRGGVTAPHRRPLVVDGEGAVQEARCTIPASR